MQALPAFDDEDFHEGRAPLALAALRGVATALNTLVYHTQCAAAGPAPGREDAAAARMLRRWPSCSYPHFDFYTATPLLYAVFPMPAKSLLQQICSQDKGWWWHRCNLSWRHAWLCLYLAQTLRNPYFLISQVGTRCPARAVRARPAPALLPAGHVAGAV